VPPPLARASWVLKGLVLALASIAALAAVEIALRYWYPIRGVLLRPHPVYLHEYIPDSRKRYHRSKADGGGSVLVTINHDGRRGPATAPADVQKIVVYGDSFIAAEYSPWSETLCARLEASIRAASPAPIQVIDAGVTGYGPDQSLLRLEADLPTLHPALVIFAVYAGNDFGDLIRDKIFDVDDEGHLVTRHPTLAPALAATFDAERDWPSLQIARAMRSTWELWRNGPTPDALSGESGGPTTNRFDRWLEQNREEYADYVSGNSEVKNLLADGYDAIVSLTPASKEAAHEVRVMRAVLARAQVDAVAAGVPMLLLVIPSPYDAVDDYPLKPDPARYPDYRPETLSRTVDGLAQELDIPYLDLFGPFSGPNAGALFFKVGNDHWNAEGERRAAALVVTELQRRHLQP